VPDDKGQDQDYEFVEVKVSHKIDIHLSLDDLLSMVQHETSALQSAAQQAPAEVSDKLNQLNQLASQVKGSLSQLGPHVGA